MKDTPNLCRHPAPPSHMKYLLIAGAFNLSNMALKEAQAYQDAESLVKHRAKKQRKTKEEKQAATKSFKKDETKE